MLRKLVLSLGIAALALAASSCNTVRGAGDDLKSAANSVDRAL